MSAVMLSEMKNGKTINVKITIDNSSENRYTFRIITRGKIRLG